MIFQEAYDTVIDQIPGLLCPGQEEFLYNAAKNSPEGCSIIEIGAYEGRSTLSMLFGIQDQKKHLYTIDKWDWPDKDVAERVIDRVQSNKLTEWFTPMKGLSKDVDISWIKNIMLCFIDGGHEYPEVKYDFFKWYDVAPVGSTILIHDYDPVPGHAFDGITTFCKEIEPVLRDVGSYKSIFYGVKI